MESYNNATCYVVAVAICVTLDDSLISKIFFPQQVYDGFDFQRFSQSLLELIYLQITSTKTKQEVQRRLTVIVHMSNILLEESESSTFLRKLCKLNLSFINEGGVTILCEVNCLPNVNTATNTDLINLSIILYYVFFIKYS